MVNMKDFFEKEFADRAEGAAVRAAKVANGGNWHLSQIENRQKGRCRVFAGSGFF